MGSIARMRTRERFDKWTKENGHGEPPKNMTFISIDGGIPEVEHVGNEGVIILDVDNLHDTEENESDYENAIEIHEAPKIIRGICPWCLEESGCSYWEHGNECNSEDKV